MKHKIFLAIICAELMVLMALAITGVISGKNMQAEITENRKLVQALMLTDLALWTEARYTRHPSQADFFTPFQDFPGAIEHFPAGAIMAPPSLSDLLDVQSNEDDIFHGE